MSKLKALIVKAIAVFAAIIASIPLFLGVLYIVVTLLFGAEDHTFDRQRGEVGAQIEKILIAGNICSESDCINKEIIFSAPKKGGFAIDVHGISNKEILSQCLSKKFLNQKNRL